ncbi:hypothetical protein F5B21DRAFT_143450 [Xylaria acuta]|nr:hypothetical protein F5B21DRAFT_143450 [Xylaria acuta]
MWDLHSGSPSFSLRLFAYIILFSLVSPAFTVEKTATRESMIIGPQVLYFGPSGDHHHAGAKHLTHFAEEARCSLYASLSPATCLFKEYSAVPIRWSPRTPGNHNMQGCYLPYV